MDYINTIYNQPLRLTHSMHSKTMMESVQSCQRRLCYTDVQLISEGGIVFAHSIVLAAASNFMKQLLLNNPDPTIVIHLPGVEYEPLRLLLDVLYGGEELQLTLKQVVALQDLGSLLHIDMCNSTAMEQAFLQASQEGVLSIPGSLQHSGDNVIYSNESSPVPTPQPSLPEPSRRSVAKSVNSPSKVSQNHNNNNNNGGSSSSKKRKSGISSQQNSQRNSPAPMAPFSLLANVSATKAGGKRMLEDDLESALIMADGTEDEPASTPAPIYKKPSRAALKEMVTCRECHTPFKLIMQLNQHMTREGHLFPPCPECSIPFTTLESLIGHADAHASETVFTCKYCQKGVLGFDRYLYHMLMCKSLIRGDYVCFICRKSFRNSGSLKTHLLLHTGAKPFPCNYCSASFRQRHHRSHHERSVHLQMQGCADGVDQAPPSEGSAPEAGNVSASQTPIVDGSRPFPCGFCNAAFRQSNHRSYHERVIHGVDRRTRQPKGSVVPRGTETVSGPSRSAKSVGNGFTVIIEPEEEEMEADENEDGDLAEELEADADPDADADADADPDADPDAEVDADADPDADPDGWEEEIPSPVPDDEEDVGEDDEASEGE